MDKLVAIESGGDWADASVTYLALPPGSDLKALHREYLGWYANVYTKGRKRNPNGWLETNGWLSFAGWLMEHKGAVDPTDDQIEVFRDD